MPKKNNKNPRFKANPQISKQLSLGPGHNSPPDERVKVRMGQVPTRIMQGVKQEKWTSECGTVITVTNFLGHAQIKNMKLTNGQG